MLRSRSRSRSLPLVAGAAGLLLLISGCTSAPSPGPTRMASSAAWTSAPTTPASTATATASATPVASSGGGSSPSATVRTDPDAPAGQCADAALRITEQADPEGGAAGHVGSWVVLQNVGTTPCALQGAPGVSVVGDSNGTQLGRPASHPTGAASPIVRIEPKGYALAQLISSSVDANGGIYADGKGGDPTCKAKRADGYRVYAPHSFRAVFAKRSVFACTTGIDWMSIGSVQGPVKGFTPKL